VAGVARVVDVSDAGREPRIGCVLTWPSIGLLFRTMLFSPLIKREGVDGRLYTGLTPHQYVIECRMEQAKRLLAATDLPLGEIGLQVGGVGHSHFTARSRTHVSMTPTASRDNTTR